jgi:hypothetical protein
MVETPLREYLAFPPSCFKSGATELNVNQQRKTSQNAGSRMVHLASRISHLIAGLLTIHVYVGFDEILPDPNWKVLQPDDVAGLVSYLVKDESRFVTGEPQSFFSFAPS